MHLKLVTPKNKDNLDTIKPVESIETAAAEIQSQMVESNMTENMKVGVLVFIMCFIPLFSYTVGKANFGHEVATHIGVGVGALCVFITSGLLYFANFLDEK